MTKTLWKLTLALLACAWLLTSCSSTTKTVAASVHDNESKPKSVTNKQNTGFLPPTAEEAYRLQDDCSRRGEQILSENYIGSALTHEQVSRYNSTTNRCYVRLEVHALSLDQWDKFTYSKYILDGQTKEMLASCSKRPGMEHETCMCFDYSIDTATCEQEMSNCMNGKNCELQSE